MVWDRITDSALLFGGATATGGGRDGNGIQFGLECGLQITPVRLPQIGFDMVILQFAFVTPLLPRLLVGFSNQT